MIDLTDLKEVELFNQVKRKLNITWEDAETTQRLFDMIPSVKEKLRYKLGIVNKDFDFSASGLENELFLNACLYEFNHASDDFDKNYANDIMQSRMRFEVMQNAD